MSPSNERSVVHAEHGTENPKIPLAAQPSRHGIGPRRKIRKKTVEACERCRERRTKCNGGRPCENCTKKGYECSLSAITPGNNEKLAQMMGQVLERLSKIEAAVQHQSSTSQLRIREGTRPLVSGMRPVSSVTEFNHRTGCFEYYGTTSSFAVASSLGKRMNLLEEIVDPSAVSSTSRQKTAHAQASPRPSDALGLETLIDSHDYVMPLSTPIRHYRSLQKDVADRHLESFVSTIHIYFPIFDISAFRTKYARLRELFGSPLLLAPHLDAQVPQQSLCLLYAILALGALYSDDGADNSSWAAWYFYEAQDFMGRMFDAVNLELVQAAMYLGAYAQHAIKSNLAYNLTGTAIRMAFSIGLNVDPTLAPHDWDPEEGRRTWWMLYIQEVELSGDSGRPMSIRSSDVVIEYPKDHLAENSPAYSDESHLQMATFIKPLAGMAQITRRILKFVAGFGAPTPPRASHHENMQDLDAMLFQWLESVPRQLRFQDTSVEWELVAPCDWMSRQRSSLLLHYNLALILLHRHSLMKPHHTAMNEDLTNMSKATCIQAARVVILHIHRLLQAVPSLRRWRYYCHYCLQATLVLLILVFDEPFAEDTKDVVTLCHLSVNIFSSIQLKAAHRCAEVVTRALHHWHERQAFGKASLERARINEASDASDQPRTQPAMTPVAAPAREAQNANSAGFRWPRDGTIALYGTQCGSSPQSIPSSGVGLSQPRLSDNCREAAGAEKNSDPPLDFGEWDNSVDDELLDSFMHPDWQSRSLETWMKIFNDTEAESSGVSRS